MTYKPLVLIWRTGIKHRVEESDREEIVRVKYSGEKEGKFALLHPLPAASIASPYETTAAPKILPLNGKDSCLIKRYLETSQRKGNTDFIYIVYFSFISIA